MAWLSRKLEGKTPADEGARAKGDVIAPCADGGMGAPDGVELAERKGEGALESVPDGRAYRTYKRRWFGLVQLVLLNIVVSWDVSLPLPPYTKGDRLTTDLHSGSPLRLSPTRPRHTTASRPQP